MLVPFSLSSPLPYPPRSVCFSLSVSLSHTRARTQTHTHPHCSFSRSSALRLILSPLCPVSGFRPLRSAPLHLTQPFSHFLSPPPSPPFLFGSICLLPGSPALSVTSPSLLHCGPRVPASLLSSLHKSPQKFCKPLLRGRLRDATAGLPLPVISASVRAPLAPGALPTQLRHLCARAPPAAWLTRGSTHRAPRVDRGLTSVPGPPLHILNRLIDTYT